MLKKAKKKSGEDGVDKTTKKPGLLSRRPKTATSKEPTADKKEKEQVDAKKTTTDIKKGMTKRSAKETIEHPTRSLSETAKKTTTKSAVSKTGAAKSEKSTVGKPKLDRTSAPPGTKNTSATPSPTSTKKAVKSVRTPTKSPSPIPKSVAPRSKSESSKTSPSLSEVSPSKTPKATRKTKTPTAGSTPPLPKGSAKKGLMSSSAKTVSPVPKSKEVPAEKEKKGMKGFAKTLTKIKNAVTPRDKKSKRTGDVSGQSVSSKTDKSAFSDRKVSQSPAPVARPRRLSTSSAGSGRSPSVSEKSLDKKVAQQKKKASASPSISSTLSPAPESKVMVDDETEHSEGGSMTPVVAVESKVEPAKLAGRDDQGVPSESPIVEEKSDEESMRKPQSEAEIQGQNDELTESSLRVTAEELIPPGSSHGLSPARSQGATEIEPPTTMSTKPQSSNTFNSASLEEPQLQQDVPFVKESMTKDPVEIETDNEVPSLKDCLTENDQEKQTKEETTSPVYTQDTESLDAAASEASKVEPEKPAIAQMVDRSLPIDMEVTVMQTISENPSIHDAALEEDVSMTKVSVECPVDPHGTALDTPTTTEAVLDEEKTLTHHQDSVDNDGASVDQDSLDLERAPSIDRTSVDAREDNLSVQSSLDIDRAHSLDRTSVRSEEGVVNDAESIGGNIDSIDGASMPASDDDGSLGNVSMEIGSVSSEDRSSLEALDIPVLKPSADKEERKRSIDALLKRTEGEMSNVAQDSMKVGDTSAPGASAANMSALAEFHAKLKSETKTLSDHANPNTESIGSLPDAQEIPDDIAKMDDLDGFSEPQSPIVRDEKVGEESDELTTPEEGYHDIESLESPTWSSQDAFPSDSEVDDDLSVTPDPSYLSEGDENAAMMELGVLTPPIEPPVTAASPVVDQPVAQPMPDPAEEAPAQTPTTSTTKKSQRWDPLQKNRPPMQRLQVRSASAEFPTPSAARKEPDVYVSGMEPVSVQNPPPLQSSLFPTREQPQNVSNQLPLTKEVQQWDPLMKQTSKVPSESSLQRPGVTVTRMGQGKGQSLDFAKQNRMPMRKLRSEEMTVKFDPTIKPSSSHRFSSDDPVEDDPPCQSSVDKDPLHSTDNPPNEEEKKHEESNSKRRKGNLIVSCALYVLGGIAVTVFFLRKRGG